MWQQILVGMIVLLAVVCLLWRLAPARWRQRIASKHPSLAKVSSSGCGGCSSCSGGGCSDHSKD